jgi:hypothetical protein
MKSIKSSDFLEESTKSEGKLPSRESWPKWVRFAGIAAVSACFTAAHSTEPVLATAIGIGAGVLDTALPHQ